MNYTKIYHALIERAQNQTIDGYVEKHHIVPRCMGGTDDKENIVGLTPEEHFLAHQLLVKMYPGVDKLIFALHRMISGKYRNNKLYGWIRKKIQLIRKGVERSAEVKLKISKSRKGQPANHTTPHTEESKIKISNARQGKGTAPKSEETRRKMSLAAKGKSKSEEHRKAVSDSKKGKPWTQARIDAYLKGKK